MNKRILVVGFGRAGKDASAFLLQNITGIPYAGSTSWSAKEIVAKKLGMHAQVCWENRHSNREHWKSICDGLRVDDQTLLIRLALASVNEDKSSGLISGWRGIVAGVRDRLELEAAKNEKIFDHILWIARPNIPPDPTVTFSAMDCDEIIFNDGDIDDLRSKLFVWAESKGLIPSLYLTPPTKDIHRE